MSSLVRVLRRVFAAAARRWGPYHRRLLVGAWLLVQAAFLVRFHGPHFANDSALYLEYAANVAAHGYYQPSAAVPGATAQQEGGSNNFEYEHSQRYILYPWFQSVWLRLHTGRWGIVLAQMALSGLAASALYGAVRRLAGGRRGAAALATGLLVVWPDVQQFNAYLLTESLFISLSMLSFWALVRLQGGARTAGALLLALLLLTALARPNGFVVAGAAALAGLAALHAQRRAWFWAALASSVLAAPLLLRVLDHQLVTYFLVETYQRGELMYGSAAWALHPTAPLHLPLPGTGQLARVGYFAAHNPGFLARLMAGKLFVFFSSLKPYYSLAHRLASVLLLWPLYALAVRGARWQEIWAPARVFLAAVPLLQAAVVMLTVDDYDVRFLAPVLPFVFALAALGVWKSWKNVDNPVGKTPVAAAPGP
ncbi:MAG: hypothetical protein ACRYFR_08440 [Janthinobacterium lividum]